MFIKKYAKWLSTFFALKEILLINFNIYLINIKKKWKKRLIYLQGFF